MRAFFVKTEALRPVFVHLVKCASPRCLFGFCFAPCCEQKVEVCHVTMWQFSHWKLARVEVVRNLFDRSLVGLCFEKKCIEHPKFHHSWVLEENVVSKRWCWSFSGPRIREGTEPQVVAVSQISNPHPRCWASIQIQSWEQWCHFSSHRTMYFGSLFAKWL